MGFEPAGRRTWPVPHPCYGEGGGRINRADTRPHPAGRIRPIFPRFPPRSKTENNPNYPLDFPRPGGMLGVCSQRPAIPAPTRRPPVRARPAAAVRPPPVWVRHPLSRLFLL